MNVPARPWRLVSIAFLLIGAPAFVILSGDRGLLSFLGQIPSDSAGRAGYTRGSGDNPGAGIAGYRAGNASVTGHKHSAVGSSATAGSATLINTLTNPSFESNGGAGTSTFTGWTVVDQAGGSGSWFVQTGTVSPGGFNTVSAPTDGTFAAMTEQGAPGSHILYQDILVPSESAVLSFDLFIGNRDGDFIVQDLDFTTYPNQHARVDIMSTEAAVNDEGAGVLKNVFITNPGDPLVSGYTTRTVSLEEFAGQTVRLRFAEVDNQGTFEVGVDNIRLTGTGLPTPTPTPTSGDLTNPSFESNGGAGTSTFTGWTVVDEDEGFGSWFVQTGTVSTGGFTVPAPTDGTFAAMTDQNGQGSHILYQDILVPPESAFLSFDLFIGNRAGDFIVQDLDFTTYPNQHARVDIMSTAAAVNDVGAGVLKNVFITNPGDPLVSGYTTRTVSLEEFAGPASGSVSESACWSPSESMSESVFESASWSRSGSMSESACLSVSGSRSESACRCRGNERREVFREDEDRERFLRSLSG